jgi:hypothetical protein
LGSIPPSVSVTPISNGTALTGGASNTIDPAPSVAQPTASVVPLVPSVSSVAVSQTPATAPDGSSIATKSNAALQNGTSSQPGTETTSATGSVTAGSILNPPAVAVSAPVPIASSPVERPGEQSPTSTAQKRRIEEVEDGDHDDPDFKRVATSGPPPLKT